MSSCRLGLKLVARIEKATNRAVRFASVGKDGHFEASVVFEDNTHAVVNYKTGKFTARTGTAACALRSGVVIHLLPARLYFDFSGWLAGLFATRQIALFISGKRITANEHD